jgi:hypothetical protein
MLRAEMLLVFRYCFRRFRVLYFGEQSPPAPGGRFKNDRIPKFLGSLQGTFTGQGHPVAGLWNAGFLENAARGYLVSAKLHYPGGINRSESASFKHSCYCKVLVMPDAATQENVLAVLKPRENGVSHVFDHEWKGPFPRCFS